MNNTSTHITAAPVPPIAVSPPLPARRVDRWRPIKQLFKPLASLRLTVVLFALSIILVFCGTLAQMDNGLWAILTGYFRAWIAWIPFQVFVRFGQVFFWFPKTWHVAGSFPFPGGYVIGGLLLINLLSAHIARFKIFNKRSQIPTIPVLEGGFKAFLYRLSMEGIHKLVAFISWILMGLSQETKDALIRIHSRFTTFIIYRIAWDRSGILITHAGIILLLLGEWVTGQFAIEGAMFIVTGDSRNDVLHLDKTELAIIDSSDPKTDHVVVVPGSILKQNVKGERIRDERLPFDIEVLRFMVNSSLPRNVMPGEENLATAGAGLEEIVDEKRSGTGTDREAQIDRASAYVTFYAKDSGASLGTYLTSLWGDNPETPGTGAEQTVKVDGKAYRIGLRFQREYKPYTLHLEEFRHDLYPGTNTPLNFSSKIRLIDPEHNVDREELIYMNNPLRYRGATFYQADWIRPDRGTKLQVVVNPGWLMPYFSCAFVALGMTIHFGMHLVNFLRRRATP